MNTLYALFVVFVELPMRLVQWLGDRADRKRRERNDIKT